MKSFAGIKNISRFAEPNNTASGTTRISMSGIFYTLLIILITVSTPVWSVNAPTARRVLGNGKAEPFFFSAKFKDINMSIPNSLQECSNGIVEPHKTRTPTKRVHSKKQSSKNFEDSENVSMFAESNATGQDIHGTTTDFLYPEESLSKNKAVQISSSPLRSVCDGSCGKDERRTAFLDNTNSNFVTTMPQEDKNLKGVDNNTITSRTPTKRVHTKKKLLEYLSVEENAKNKAYYYIISSGNLEQFTNFCKQLPDGIDYGAACTAALILQFFNPQKTTL